MGTILYPSAKIASNVAGNAEGVFFAPLWNNTIEPGEILDKTLFFISSGVGSFQSKLSLLVIKES